MHLHILHVHVHDEDDGDDSGEDALDVERDGDQGV